MVIIISILSALLTLIGVLYEKITKHKNLRIITLIAVIGFIIAISQIAINEIDSNAKKRDQNNRDSLLSQIRLFSKSTLANTDTIKVVLKNGNLSDIGAEIHLQKVSVNALKFDTDIHADPKGWVFRGMYTSIPLHTTPVFTGIIAPSMPYHH